MAKGSFSAGELPVRTVWGVALLPVCALNVSDVGLALSVGQPEQAVARLPPIPKVVDTPWSEPEDVMVYVPWLVGEPIRVSLNASGIGAGIELLDGNAIVAVNVAVTIELKVQLLIVNVSLPPGLTAKTPVAPEHGTVRIPALKVRVRSLYVIDDALYVTFTGLRSVLAVKERPLSPSGSSTLVETTAVPVQVAVPPVTGVAEVGGLLKL
jgi:hypothetical protein